MSKQKREVEWTFDFENIGDRVNEFFNDVIGKDVTVETAELAEPLNGATSAVVKVDFSVGRALVTALTPDSDNLFEGKITYVGDYQFEVMGTDQRKITLRQKGRFPRGFARMLGNVDDLLWDIALNPSVPYTLRLKGGVGEADIDLTNLTVGKMKLDTGVGKVVVTLPIQDTPIDASLSGGVGKTDVIIPAGLSGHLDINGGVGAVDVEVAPDAAIRIEADSGLGGLDLPRSFERISGDGHFIGTKGIWQTTNFADAEKQITIDYDGGVGSFRLKYFEVV